MDFKNIDPAMLPVPLPLRKAIAAWGRRYEGTYNRQDPGASAFRSVEEEVAFDHEGRRLSRELQRELGEQAQVEYFSVLHGWEP